MEDLLLNCIRLQSEWLEIEKDEYYLKQYLSKRPREMEEYIKKVEDYEIKVLKTPTYETYRKEFLDKIKRYKEKLATYQNANNSSNPLQKYSSDLLFFMLFFCVGSLLTVVWNEYTEKSSKAKEKGLREGFSEKLNEILKKHGVTHEKAN
jgi:hypothetical protein